MKIFAIVPVKRFEKGKSRLSPLLNIDERKKLSELLLDDTLSILLRTTAICEVIVVSSDNRAKEIAERFGAKYLKENKDSGVNKAVALADSYSSQSGAEATLVIPQDLPLLRPEDIDIMCEAAEEHERCLIICPSLKYDGTNALLRRPSSLLKTHYDNNSYNMHVKIARKIGVDTRIFLSRRIMIDIDTIEDIENLLKESSRSRAIAYIKSALDFDSAAFNRYSLYKD